MRFEVLSAVVSILANVATAIGLPVIGYQLLVAARQRRKESSQTVWDLLAAHDVYLARNYIQTHDVPTDLGLEMASDGAWITNALKCFLAYQKASHLVLDHQWMKPQVFAEQWGFSALVVWTRLESWIRWYRTAYAYPGFGRSFEVLVEAVRKQSVVAGFNEQHFSAQSLLSNVTED